MKHYEVEVIEIRRVSVLYIVEAASSEEARSKAASGETIEESDGRDIEVADRIVMADPTELDEAA